VEDEEKVISATSNEMIAKRNSSSRNNEDKDSDDSPRCRKRRRLERSASPQEFAVEEDDGEGFIYRRPLLVSQKSIEENHYMGITLVLIVMFNLALTHHLMYLEAKQTKNSSSSDRERFFVKAVQLYELAYQSYLDYVQQRERNQKRQQRRMSLNSANSNRRRGHCGSLRLTMVLSNNLGQIHRAAGNTRKHGLCLQHLLRVIMYAVECGLVNSVLNPSEFDGTYRNVSPIVFEESPCASAA